VDPYLARLQREIASATTGLLPQELIAHAPGKWCSAEILEHLFLTYTGTTRGFGRVVNSGTPLATVSTWKQRGQAWVVVGLGYMPTGREAPSVARPRGAPSEEVLTTIGAQIAAMDDIMSTCEAKFGSRIKVLDHPILGPLSIDQWRRFHLVHGLHHVKQIRRLRRELSSDSTKS
jgi:hypothetical protein